MSSSAPLPTKPAAQADTHKRVVRLVWSVSSGAIARLCAGAAHGSGRKGGELSLETSIAPDASGETVVRCGNAELARESHGPGSVVVTSDPGRGLQHMDIAGVLSQTTRSGEVIFARAPIFERLGLEGGRYELAPTKDAER